VICIAFQLPVLDLGSKALIRECEHAAVSLVKR
jgi:hypothetical protein